MRTETTRRGVRSSLPLGLALALLGGCDDGGGPSTRDSITNWLAPCAATADCGGAGECVCGVCSLICDQAATCERLAVGARCTPTASPPAGLSCVADDVDRASGLCLPGCASSADCAAIAPGLACLGGVCAPALLGDAGTPPPPPPPPPPCTVSCDNGGVCEGDVCHCPSGTQPPTCAALGPLRVVSVGEHLCAIRSELYCWGRNDSGQLGLGDTEHRGDDPDEVGPSLPPVLLPADLDVHSVHVGGSHTCIIDSRGAVYCWGANESGQLGLGHTDAIGDAPEEMGEALVAVDLGGGPTIGLAMGTSHTCARAASGEVRCWGNNGAGRLGYGDREARGDEPGELGLTLAPVDLGGVATELTAGAQHTCALLEDQSVRCWGWNITGKLGIGDTEHRGDDPGEMGSDLPPVDLGGGARGVVAAGQHTCATLLDGGVKCWGFNHAGQLGQGDTQTRGDQPGEIASLAPIDVGGEIAALGVGGLHVCATRADGTLTCWGENDLGQLGLGDTLDRGDEPDEMGVGMAVSTPGPEGGEVSARMGGKTTCVMFDHAELRCFGDNRYGQLGRGDSELIGDQPGEVTVDMASVPLP